jgi:DUF4097 and DUF4098 domain-containing protein YvlB
MRFRSDLLDRALPAAALACVLAAGLQTPAAHAADFDRSFTFASQRLTLTNLIGSVRVEKATGNAYKIDVHVRGEDADPKWITFDEGQGSAGKLTVRFPLDEHRKYVYPKLGAGSRSTFTASHHGSDDWFEELYDLARGDRIEVRGSGGGSNALELWADVVVQVPAGHETIVQLGIGEITAAHVAADLDLKTKAGAVQAEDIQGDLRVDTGSGGVDVKGVRGDCDIDTGSGSVDVADVTAQRLVRVDTGSGGIQVSSVTADELSLDTGSGSIDLDKITVKDLSVDTGSGGVDGSTVAADDLKIDTGSGSVDLDLVRMGHGRYTVETGSGGIRLDMPREISAVFDVETASGGIDADIDGVTLGRHDRYEAHFKVGNGDARVSLSAGSGHIRLAQGNGSAQR